VFVGRIPLNNAFKVLKDHGINTLMIEGGSQIIQSSLKNAWDQLIITTGPLFIGSDGIPAIVDNQDINLTNIKYQVFGRDSVMSANKLL
jgi:2,5-diamino-6-(ribosylamino)-4(3H)-pyrimidinone 5'-phosphate reductase